MPNPYVNKVQQADGTVIMDISDTTAVAADVVSGKTLYKADGEKVTGTASESVIGKRTGNPIDIPDGTAGAELVYLQAAFAPQQAGSGTPTPTNIRAISGWTGCNVYISPTTDPQDGETKVIDWSSQGAIYGGYVDVLGGKIVSDTVIKTLTGTESWTMTNNGQGDYFRHSITGDRTLYRTTDATCVSSHFTQASMSTGESGIYRCYNSDGTANYFLAIRPGVDGLTSAALFKQWLADQYSAGTPVQVMYKRQSAALVEYAITPVSSIELLSGTNYIWTSMSGECACLYYTQNGENYRSDIEPVYQSKTNISPTTSSQTITPDTGYDALSSVQINAMPSGAVTAPATITGSSASASLGTGGTSITLTKTVSVTPDVTTAGYISAGTAGNSDISLTATGTFSTTFVQGEFTTNSTTGVQNITIPYSGSGYPIMVVVVAKGGTYGNTTWKEAVQQYTVGCWSMTKSYMNSTPTYETSGSANYGGILVVYKNSASNKDSYARTGSVSNNTYTSSDPSNTALNCVKITGNKAMKVYVNTGGYGLLQSTDYSYYILYSA